jgi:UTP--glucose-1-phosphate uridylyltransferase
MEAAEAKMRAAGIGPVGIATFRRLHGLLVAGDRGVLPSAELEPVRDLPRLADLPEAGEPRLLDRVVVLRLNGGLGTTMGLDGPKSLIEVKPGKRFLDVIARQVEHLRRATGARLPLVLMNSASTEAPSLAALPDDAGADLPPSFLQHVEPRLRADDLQPLEVPEDPAQEWCPPGHGDLYGALRASGMLAAMLERGYTHAFVANADNLGAVLEPRILQHVAAEDVPFLMEVVLGTPADRKGGHIARRDGRLVLRETAQAPAGEEASFRDYERWRYYNANNLWIDLRVLDAADDVLPLPLIVNPKTVAGVEVLQLETAMGSALGVIDGARALEVPRTRFAPVKSTEDLLLVRSDAYELAEDGRMLPVGEQPLVELDPAHYKRLPDLEARFPAGPPSLKRCTRFTVRGDVRFGRDVTAVGAVEVTGPAEIPDGAVLGA